MLHLLSIEFLKLQRNRSFIILTALFAISVFGVNYIVSQIISDIPTDKTMITFSKSWIIVPYISSFLLVIPGFITIMHTCAEYTYRTNRQNIIDGLSRNQYIATKILFVVVLTLFSTIITFISALVIEISSDTTFSFNGFGYIFYFFVQTLTYTSVAFLFALLLKKTALATGIFFIYSLIVENVLESYINKINIIGIEKMGGFLPISSSEHLLMPEELKTVMRMVNISDPHSEYAYLIVSIVYIVLCCFACFCRYRKQDL